MLDHLLDKNPVFRLGPPSVDFIVQFAVDNILCRMNEGTWEQGDERPVDMLDTFLEIHKNDPENFDFNQVVTCALTNILAGGHTAASSLTSLFYFVLKNPRVLEKLQAELDSANLKVPVSYKDAQNLPYLDAVIRETFRLQPAVGLILERVVPGVGLVLPDGRFLPAGTIVGMNPYVLHRNEDVFGSSPDEFIPERWLKRSSENVETYQARLSIMNGSDLTFGFGSRSCLGKNISLIEVYKLAVSLFLTYEVCCVSFQFY